MFSSLRKVHPVVKILNGSLVDLPAPVNLSGWWNFGSLLGVCLVIQILTGLFLSMHYVGDVSMAFDSISHIVRDVNYGWFLRSVHANSASFFFLFTYSHMGRGVYYGSFLFFETWNIGMLMLLVLCLTAFIGYVLPWGQMSFWGATVITNLLSAVPYIGGLLVEWVWGGFSVGGATLTRFFMMHFLFPFVIVGLGVFHLFFLHQSGSGNPLGISGDGDKVSFHPYFVVKDFVGFLSFFLLLGFIIFFYPSLLLDPDNFVPANPLSTPPHIQPEWYFLFAYAILRSVPNKLGGVIALVMSILVFFFLPLFSVGSFRSMSFYPVSQIFFWGFVSVFVLLTWVGARPVEAPYNWLGCIFSFLYFIYFILSMVVTFGWDMLLSE